MNAIKAITHALVPQDTRTRIRAWHYMRQKPGGPIFVHVGKCGGTSLLDAFRQSSRDQDFFYVRMTRPPLNVRWRYLIAVRNPLSRFVSAFNHHKRSYHSGFAERGNPRDIKKLFSRYENVVDLAHDLRRDGNFNNDLIYLISRIGHLSRGPAFYLEKLLACPASQRIEMVFAQETLADDIGSYFGLTEVSNRRAFSRSDWSQSLDDVAAQNLAALLEPDFQSIQKLYALGKIDAEKAALLMDRPSQAMLA